MTTASLRSSDWKSAQELSSSPRLRLLARSKHAHLGGGQRRAPGATPAAGPRGLTAAAPHASLGAPRRASRDAAPVLVAGAHAATRAATRAELGELMPEGTCFEELGTFWELLERAPRSRMVVLSGPLGELSAETLLRSLTHRHPDLPVVSIETAARV